MICLHNSLCDDDAIGSDECNKTIPSSSSFSSRVIDFHESAQLVALLAIRLSGTICVLS